MPKDLTIRQYIEQILALADKYDAAGQYHLSDRLFDILNKFHLNSLPTEIKLRILNHGKNSQNMSSTEGGRGYVPVRYNAPAYGSGKGQAAFRDSLPMDVYFI